MRHKFNLSTPRGRSLPAATAALALVIFFADVFTPPDCVVSGVYVVVVLMAGRFCSVPELRRICLGCAGLTVLAQALAHRLVVGDSQVGYIGAFNTGVSILAISLSGYLVLRGKAAEEALHRAHSDLAHVSRMTTMGELTASIAHEVNQPIAGVITNAGACLRWLAAETPDVGEARAALKRIMRDATRAAEIITRVRQIFTKGRPQRQMTDINIVARETVDLLGNELSRYSISVRADLASNVPQVLADAVQLQQVLANLIANGVDAMKDVKGTRELVLKSWRAEDGGVAMSVSDSGTGLPSEPADQLFKAFFTTKPHGTGMGLSISHSIIEAHGGELSAIPNSPRGATFRLTLPVPPPGSEL